MEEEGFEILYKNEYFPKIKFFDLGAIEFFAKIIEWEFINFSVKDSIDKFEILENRLKKMDILNLQSIDLSSLLKRNKN